MTGDAGGIRLGGLTSGFDTESIIQQILSVDQGVIDRLNEEKEVNIAKIDTWNDVSEQLKSFSSTIIKLRADGTSGNTLFDDKTINSSDTTVATAAATSSAVVADYTVVTTALARSHVAYGAQKASTYTLPSGGNIRLNGTVIALDTGDTLNDIANKITGATYPANEEVVATVIDDRLTLQTKQSGASATLYGNAAGAPPFNNGTDDPSSILQAELGIIDGSGNLANEAQTSADAAFTINGITVTRSSNTVDDVVSGMTFNLLKTGTTNLQVRHNTEAIKETISDFVDEYNELRDLIDRVRNAKLDENEQFGLFFSDPLLRTLFGESRSLTTSGVRMGGAEWDGKPSATAASAGDTKMIIENLSASTGTLRAGDEFVIDGDTTIYTLQSDADISGGSSKISFYPPLSAATTGGEIIRVALRSLEDFGVGVRTDTVSGLDGVLGITDGGQLDAMLSSNVDLIKKIFTRSDSQSGSTGIARRLYDWVDNQTKVSAFSNKTRNIDDIKIDGLEDSNESLDERIEVLEARLASKEESLIRQFAEMENAMSQAQSASSSLAGLSGGGGG